eukprot:3174514-Amphidinium_carterae.1
MISKLEGGLLDDKWHEGHKDMSLRCESHTCTEHDHDTCCVSQPSCSTMTCPTLTVLRLPPVTPNHEQ